MTPNPNQNQEKHSAEPWRTGDMLKHVVFAGDGSIVCDCGHRSSAEVSDATAARIVAVGNFCAGVTHLEGFLPLDQMLSNSRKRCAENVNLEAHLNTFREYVHELTGSEGEDDALTVLKRHIDGLTTELSTLRKANEDANKLIGAQADESDKVFSKLRKELEAAKKAQGWTETLTQWLLERLSLTARSAKEWNESEPGCGQSIWREGMGVGLWEAQTALQRLQRGENIMDDFEDTRLNNGKDGAILERIEKEKK